MQKKLLAIFMTLVMAVSFAGCKDDSSKTSKNDNTSVEDNSESNSDEKAPENGDYKTINNGTEISEYLGTDSVVSIPEEINGTKISIIGMYAFDRKETTEIILPNGLTSLGYGAFYYCKNLEKITLPDTLERIGEFAFIGCEKLTNVEIPESVTEIGQKAFEECENISVTFKGNTYDYAHIEDLYSLFSE